MKRLPTLFWVKDGKVVRQPYNDNAYRILDGGEEWIPRRKWDGIAAYCDPNGGWYTRLEHPGNLRIPTGFIECGISRDTDAYGNPRKRWGWVPVEESVFKPHMRQALLHYKPEIVPDSTYELCGPGVRRSGNSEGFTVPTLIRHADSEICTDLHARPMDFDSLREFFTGPLAASGWEGIVWHRQSSIGVKMLKLRVKDF